MRCVTLLWPSSRHWAQGAGLPPVSVTQCRLQRNMLLLTGGTAASILPEHDVPAPWDGGCAGDESLSLLGVAEHRAPLV